MNEKLPEYTPEEQARLRRQRGGFVIGESRRGDIERTETGAWELTEKGRENLIPKAREEMEKELASGKEQEPAPEVKQEPASETGEAKKIEPLKKEIEAMPENERKNLGIGLGTIGFFLEEQKDKFFAKTFGAVEKGFKEKSAMRRFFSSLRENFSRDAERARKNIDEVSRGKSKKLLNSGYLAGNVIKYGRTAADVIGWTAASPLRYVMISAMGFARGAEAAKEARFKNEKVIEKTRVNDIDKAADEAWRIYEEAAKEASGKKPTKELLEKAYSSGLPKDILARLKENPEPGVVTGITQKIARKYAEYSAGNVERRVKKIDANEKLSEAEKKNRKDKLFNSYSRRLKDLDRMVSKYGTVDVLALGAEAAEKGAKAVVAATMVESLYLTAQKVWEHLPTIFATMEWFPSVPEQIEVKKGDSVWKILERQLSSSHGQKFSGLNESQKTYILDALKDKVVANPGKYGLDDPDKLKIGQKIKIGGLFRDQKEIGSIFSKAEKLTAADMENIKKNNLFLRQWVRDHPGESLTSQKVDEILTGMKLEKTGTKGLKLKESAEPAAGILSEADAEAEVPAGLSQETQEILIQKAGSEGMPRYIIDKIFSNPEDMKKSVSQFLSDADGEYQLMNDTAPEARWTSEQLDLARDRKGLADFIRKKTGDFRGGPYGKFKMKDFLSELSRGYK